MTRPKEAAAQLLQSDLARLEGLLSRPGGSDDACVEVIVFVRLEQELLLPALGAMPRDEDVLDEAEEGVEQLRDMVSQVLALPPGNPLREAKFAVLRDYALRHIALLRGRLLPLLQGTRSAAAGLARNWKQRRQELAAVTDALREELLATTLTS